MAYYFGSLQLTNSGGYGYFVLSRNFDLPKTRPAEFAMARRDGSKRSGGMIEARSVPLEIRVIGSSYTDMLSRLDTLKQGLMQAAQPLSLHPDGRYWQSVDCIEATAKIGPSNVVQCPVSCVFRAYDPYSYAASSSSYDTGTVALTLSGSLWNFPSISITGGGTVYSYPLFHITNKTSTGSTTLTAARNSGTAYTTIAVAATSFSGVIGDSLTITHGGVTQTLVASAGWSVGATTINVNSFTASANYVNGDVAAKVTQWMSISITQTQDAQTLSANTSSSVVLPSANGDYVDIQCDPALSVGGNIQTNGSGLYSEPSGILLVIESGLTTFTISIASASAILADCLISWKARYV